jgi:hypothetical protein
MNDSKLQVWSSDSVVPIKNQKDGTCAECRLRRLSNGDLPQVLALYDLMVNWSAGPENFWRYPDATVAEFLGTHGIVAGAFVRERLVGFRVLYFHPENDPGNPLLSTRFPCRQTGHLAVSAVDPDFLGNSLQIQMSSAVMNWAREEKRDFRSICSVVAPHNIASLKDKFVLNMWVVNLMPKFGGAWRYIFYRDMKEDVPFCPAETVMVRAGRDFDRQTELLEHGWVGFALENRADDPYVLFGKPYLPLNREPLNG